jgi:hypothetical protein
MNRISPFLRTLTLAVALGLTGVASASAAQIEGGVTVEAAPALDADKFPTVPGTVAKLQSDGTAAAPSLAPLEVQQAIWAANKLIGKPYRYGGGHRRFNDTGYDCSGTISFALKGGQLLKTPLDSSSFMNWGDRGAGEWITVYANAGHAFVVIAGLRLDTSAAGDPSRAKGPRWRPVLRSTSGFRATHPVSL